MFILNVYECVRKWYLRYHVIRMGFVRFGLKTESMDMTSPMVLYTNIDLKLRIK